MFQIEIVKGETWFVCNVCDEGCESDIEVRKHVIKEHKDVMSRVYSETYIEIAQLGDDPTFACKLCGEGFDNNVRKRSTLRRNKKKLFVLSKMIVIANTVSV